MKYTPIIGLEVHVELKTKSKMFCACSADYFGKEPNTHTCPVCLGLPGALPVPNKTAIEWCVMIAHALKCNINEFSKFDRKNYFYPDLPKGYQISQYDLPFGKKGSISLSGGKKIGITRVHMEEDTGKLIHQEVDGKKVSLVDYNRSGVPLVEIVTEPHFNDVKEVVEYLQRLQTTVRYLDVSNADMEKGDMRLEPNISLSTINNQQGKAGLPNYKVEVKNINSFKFVEKAIQYELKRQEEILEKGDTPTQETRGWDETRQLTFSQRVKEEANDYRYFPEPDIPPIILSKEQISSIKKRVPELRGEKAFRFASEYGLSEYDSQQLTREKELADFFEETVKQGKKNNISAKQIANIMINKKMSTPSEVIASVLEHTRKEAVSEDELHIAITTVLAENQKAVQEYKNGKETVLMFLLGQTMRALGKKVDIALVKQALLNALR